MKLTVDDLVNAIQAARNLERLQADLRNALIDKIIGKNPSDVPANTPLPGASDNP